MWYGCKINGQDFYSKVKPVWWGRNPDAVEVTAKTKKELFAKLDRIK